MAKSVKGGKKGQELGWGKGKGKGGGKREGLGVGKKARAKKKWVRMGKRGQGLRVGKRDKG